MNDKNNEFNNVKLSVKDRIKIFDNKETKTEDKKNITKDKNVNKKINDNLEKKTNFQNTSQIFNKNHIGAKIENKIKNNNSLAENKNKKSCSTLENKYKNNSSTSENKNCISNNEKKNKNNDSTNENKNSSSTSENKNNNNLKVENKNNNIKIENKNNKNNNNNLKVESKNFNPKIENEKNKKNENKSIEKRKIKKETKEINNFNDTKITPKRYPNPFNEDTIKSNKSEFIANIVNKYNQTDKNNNEQNENKIINKNKNNLKETTNKTTMKSNNPKNIKHKKIDPSDSKNSSGIVPDIKEKTISNFSNNIANTYKEIKSHFNENKINLKKNLENNNIKEIKSKINNENCRNDEKRYSIQLRLDLSSIFNEKNKSISQRETIKISNKSPNNLYLIKKINNSKKEDNPFKTKKPEKNKKILNNNIKKKSNNSPIKDDRINKSIEKRENEGDNSTRTTKCKTIYKSNKKKEELKEVILEETKLNSETKTNSFCKAFALSSIPKKDFKIIEETEGETAYCRHEECSKLPAIEPEIIYKYPEKDTKELEISNIIAHFGFPNFIKICIHKDESKIIPGNSYKTCLTNQVGDRYYVMLFHFYVKMKLNDFYNKYEGTQIIKEKIESLDNSNIEYVYIPHCICLISKYTFFWQMNVCLESIFLSIRDSKTKYEDIKEILNYIINSVPSPYVNTSINFPVPNCSHLIELYPCYYQDFEIYLNTPINLLDKLNNNNILLLIRLLLMEQKILFISYDYNNLIKVSMNLMSLLYPFSWVNIYIPIITRTFLKYLESFLPYFCGMHKSLYEKDEVKNTLVKTQKELFIFDIDKNEFDISRNINAKKKRDAIKYINEHVPNFPKKIEDLILSQLGILNSYYKKSMDSKDKNLNKRDNIISSCIKLKEIFIQAFIELFFEYKKYLSIIGDIPIFNTKSFIKDKTKNEKEFFKEFTNTQIFQIFIQNSSNYINNKNEKYYFDELMEDYLAKKALEDEKVQLGYKIILNNKFENEMNKRLFQITKIYYTKSTNLKLFEAMKEDLIDKKDKEYLEQLKKNLTNKFKYHTLLNEQGRLKNSNKIIDHELIIFDNYNESLNENKKNKEYYYYYFLTKEEKEKIKEDKDKIRKNSKKNKIINLESNDEEKLSEEKREIIKDNIDSRLRRIFRAEKVNVKKDPETLLSAMETEYGKNYFLSLFNLNNFKKHVNFLNEDSFQILFEVVTKTISKLSFDKLKNRLFTMKLLKSFSYFKKFKEKEEISFLEKILEYFSNDNKITIFKEINFWEMWVEEELKKENEELFNNFINSSDNTKEYIFIDKDEVNVIEFINKAKSCIEELIDIMTEIKIDKDLILAVIENLCTKFIQSDEYQSKIVSKLMGMDKI